MQFINRTVAPFQSCIVCFRGDASRSAGRLSARTRGAWTICVDCVPPELRRDYALFLDALDTDPDGTTYEGAGRVPMIHPPSDWEGS